LPHQVAPGILGGHAALSADDGRSRAIPDPLPLTFRELAGILDWASPRREREARIVSLWKACFDEATDGQQQEDFLVAGLIASKRQWDKLYKAWTKALARGKAIPYYSSKEGGKRHEQGTIFYNWSDEEVRRKRVQLAGVIRCHAGRQYASAMRLDRFWPIAQHAPALPRQWCDPYLPSFAMALQMVAYYMYDQAAAYAGRIKAPVIIFDDVSSTKHRNRIRAIFEEYARAPREDPVYAVGKWLRREPLFMEDQHEEPGLQMADLIADAYRDSRRLSRRGLPESPVRTALGDNFNGMELGPDQIRAWKRGLLGLLDTRKKPRP
jgi:hypothetical protein